MKKILQFFIILLPWFFSTIFISDYSFYQMINLPSFAPTSIVFAIVWTILYVLIAISIYKIYQIYGYKQNKEYNHILLFNYISNQLFSILFFGFHFLFLSFVDTVVVTISSLFLYYEAKSLDEKSSKLLLPYLFWNLFALILMFTIYFMNL